LGSVGANINAAAGHGKTDTSAYTAVYGESYNHNISCTKEEVCHYMNHIVSELLLLPELAISWIYMAARSGTTDVLELAVTDPGTRILSNLPYHTQ
jgi:hypothetical protein